MFDPNKFKKAIKEWVKMHSNASIGEFVDFCEAQIPAPHFAANQWLIEQSLSWYEHILAQRKAAQEADRLHESGIE